ncbi:MAG TPA: RNA-binding cell elongation regulator Jag/EloR [Ktedonobacteraceae bacterium]
MESIEVSGKSVDDALLQALVRLHKRRDEVDVTILQEPARSGAFGIGGKEARIRVTVLPPRGSAVITPEMADALLGPDDEELYEDEELDEGEEDEEFEEDGEYEDEDEDEDEDGEYEDEVFGEEYEAKPYQSALPLAQAIAEIGQITVAEGEMQEVENPSTEDIDVTVDVLRHILQFMNIRASIQVRSQSPLTLNIQGMNENLGLLIGRRGETLAALQLLVSLIVSHRTKHRMRIIVDAENYRERREENLRSLAQRVAQQVRNYRRSIALEAMPPHERRIVHIALAESKDISTESIGEGDARRVVISLKRAGR